MRFGKNTDVNYKAPPVATQEVMKTVTPSKTTQESSETRPPSQTTQANPKTTQANKPKIPSTSVASEILGISMMVGVFLISRYII